MKENIWFTADLHLGHDDIIGYCNRPFASIEEHDEALIKNWNDCVENRDRVYIIGDFAFKNHNEYLTRLNGRKYFIIGSHDTMNVETKKNFITVSELKTVRYRNRFFELCHYPLRNWERCWEGSVMLFGHCHNRVSTYNLSFDVGVDANNYKPFSVVEIMTKVKDRESDMRKNRRIVKEPDGKTRYYQDDVKWMEFLLKKSENK